MGGGQRTGEISSEDKGGGRGVERRKWGTMNGNGECGTDDQVQFHLSY